MRLATVASIQAWVASYVHQGEHMDALTDHQEEHMYGNRGVMLWLGVASAPWLALMLLPVELVFWTGFALPFGFVFGLTRTVLVVLKLANEPEE